MNRSKAVWYLGAVLAAGAMLLALRLFIVGVVAAAVLALLLNLERSPAGSGEERHLAATRSTGPVALLAVVAFGAQMLGAQVPLGIFVCGAAAALAALDLAVSAVAVRKVGCSFAFDRTEITVGEAATATVEIMGPRLPFSLKIGESFERAVEPRARGPVTVTPAARTVLAGFSVEARSTGLCGLAGFRRRWHVAAPTPLFAAPAPLAPDQPFPDLAGRWGEGANLPGPTGDVVRGVRDYVPGDRRAQVHWRTSARTGRLVVKELEDSFIPRLLLVLDLGLGGEAAERAAARAAWYLGEARRRGAEVELATREVAGIRSERAESASDAVRRLACASVGPLPPSPRARPGESVLRVGPEGDECR